MWVDNKHRLNDVLKLPLVVTAMARFPSEEFVQVAESVGLYFIVLGRCYPEPPTSFSL